jgi:hypothetical protein
MQTLFIKVSEFKEMEFLGLLGWRVRVILILSLVNADLSAYLNEEGYWYVLELRLSLLSNLVLLQVQDISHIG